MSEWTYIGLAFALTWLTLAGYAGHLGRRHARARNELERARKDQGVGK